MFVPMRSYAALLPLALAIALLSGGCGGGETPRAEPGAATSDSSPNGAAAHSASSGEGTAASGSVPGGGAATTFPVMRYTSRSGEYDLSATSPLGEEVSATVYYDDHGERQATYTTIVATVDGKPLTIRNVSLISDGSVVLYDPARKVATRSRLEPGALNQIPDFSRLSPAQLQAIDHRPLGTMEILGHAADGHAWKHNGLEMKAWIWEGMPLRSELAITAGAPIVTTATAIRADQPVAPERFELPDGMAVKDAVVPGSPPPKP